MFGGRAKLGQDAGRTGEVPLEGKREPAFEPAFEPAREACLELCFELMVEWTSQASPALRDLRAPQDTHTHMRTREQTHTHTHTHTPVGLRPPLLRIYRVTPLARVGTKIFSVYLLAGLPVLLPP